MHQYCDLVQTTGSKVSPHILKEFCLHKRIIAFAKIKEVNENLREKVQVSEIVLEKLKKDSKTRLTEKDQEISSLKHEATITKDQLETMIESYQSCKKELESTQITCEKWVESCNGYEMLLEKQIKSNVKFGVGFRKHDNEQPSNTSIDSEMVEIIPTNSIGEKKIKIIESSGKKITLEKP
ncbi:hypothetical protein HanRHA438_Chr02g0068361 [Helianthus annuus]|nr:hypothetical protein HanRHA438_Chr02g0068361 [Helianthus annuus]